MALDYDPFSDEVMRDPFPLYAAMRAEGGPHYIEKYNAWALARFEDVWEASSRHEKDITFTAGQTPGQLPIASGAVLFVRPIRQMPRRSSGIGFGN